MVMNLFYRYSMIKSSIMAVLDLVFVICKELFKYPYNSRTVHVFLLIVHKIFASNQKYLAIVKLKGSQS